MIPNLIDIILVMLRPSFIVRIDTANCINRTNKDYDIFRNYQKSVIKDKSSCEQHADGIQSYLILLKPSFIHLTSTRPSVGISEGLPVISLFMANLARFSAVFTTFLNQKLHWLPQVSMLHGYTTVQSLITLFPLLIQRANEFWSA